MARDTEAKAKQPVAADGGAKKHGRKGSDAPLRAVTKGTLRIGAEAEQPGSPAAEFVDREASRGARLQRVPDAGLPVPGTARPPSDSRPKDLPKEQDDRSAPKGNITAGQAERNPELETRDEFRPTRPAPEKAMTAAHRVADREGREQRRKTARPRPKAATPNRRPRRGATQQAPKDAERNAKRAAAERKPGPGRRGSAGTANRKRPAPRAKRTAPRAKRTGR